jgi:hypothetical protein
VNTLNIQKAGYDADGDISDSTSLPSLNSDKDSKVNVYKSTIVVNFSFFYSISYLKSLHYHHKMDMIHPLIHMKIHRLN